MTRPIALMLAFLAWILAYTVFSVWLTKVIFQPERVCPQFLPFGS